MTKTRAFSFAILVLLSGSIDSQFNQTKLMASPQPLPPSGFSRLIVGNPGTTTAYYWVSAIYPQGETSLVGPLEVTNVPNSLSSTHNVQLNWLVQGEETGFNVLKTKNPAYPTGTSTILLGNTTSNFIRDTGQELRSYTVPLNPRAMGYISDQKPASSSGTILDASGVSNWNVRTLSGIRFADQFPNLSAAVADAGSTGSLLIPSNYKGTDALNNPNGLPVLDLRRGYLSVWSSIGTVYPTVAGGVTYPEGNDMRIVTKGPSDFYLEKLSVNTTMKELGAAGKYLNVPVGPVLVSNYRNGDLYIEQTGDTSLFALFGIDLGRETPTEEFLSYSPTLGPGTWRVSKVSGATHLDLQTTKTHFGTVDIEQGPGSTLLTVPNIWINSAGTKPSQNTTYNAPLRVLDATGRVTLYAPSSINDIWPYGAYRFVAVLTGQNGANNNNLIIRNLNSSSQVQILKSTNASTLATIDDLGNLTATGSLISPVFSSSSANPAPTGVVRLASADAINFRNSANSADVNGLSKDASDITEVGGAKGIRIGGGTLRSGNAKNTDLAGQLTLNGGTANYTFTGTYVTAPVCVASDTTAANAVKVSTTARILTVTGTGMDGVNYICMGRN